MNKFVILYLNIVVILEALLTVVLVVISSCDIYNLCSLFKDTMVFYISTVIIEK
jgi:hypothetical protein